MGDPLSNTAAVLQVSSRANDVRIAPTRENIQKLIDSIVKLIGKFAGKPAPELLTYYRVHVMLLADIFAAMHNNVEFSKAMAPLEKNLDDYRDHANSLASDVDIVLKLPEEAPLATNVDSELASIAASAVSQRRVLLTTASKTVQAYLEEGSKMQDALTQKLAELDEQIKALPEGTSTEKITKGAISVRRESIEYELSDTLRSVADKLGGRAAALTRASRSLDAINPAKP